MCRNDFAAHLKENLMTIIMPQQSNTSLFFLLFLFFYISTTLKKSKENYKVLKCPQCPLFFNQAAVAQYCSGS